MSAQVEKKSENINVTTPSILISSPAVSCSEDSSGRVDIEEDIDFKDVRSLSTSAVLSACKHKILKPYLRLLAVMGFRSFGSDGSRIWRVLNKFHLTQVIAFTLFGYVLQYLGCFRRDRGLACGSNRSFENAAFGLILPSLLHLFGYGYILYLFRFKETERLENLMEKTFLLSASRADGWKANLVKRLWIFILVGILWILASLCAVSVLVTKENFDTFPWLHSDVRKTLFETFLILSALWQDMIQASVIASYCLQVELLSSSLYFLQEKLLQHTIQPLSWIREVNECQNMLNYLNRDFSPGVCIFIFLDTSWMVSCLLWFLKKGNLNEKISIIVAVGLWAVAVLAPFALAAHLTSVCKNLRRSGHQVRIRPFVYQDTPGEDLDTILLYTSTLKMKSKLFSIPIAGPYLCLCFTLIAISVFVTGQSCLF